MVPEEASARLRKTAVGLINVGTAPKELGNLLSKVAKNLKMDPALAQREIAQFEYRAVLDPRFPAPGAGMFHGLPGELVRTVEPHTEAHAVAFLLQFLAAFGIAIGPEPYFMVGEDRHQLKIWPLIVGVTSRGRKGVSATIVRRVMREVDKEFVDTRMQSGLSSGEGLIYAVRDAVEEENEEGEEPTIVDKGVDDKRLMVLESEFASVLKLLKREGSTLSPTLRQAWDVDFLRILNKNSPIKATGAHIGIVGHITQQELLRYLDETEMANGFANRFFWVCSQREKLLPSPRPIADKLMAPLVRRLRAAKKFAGTVHEIFRSEKAELVWEQYYFDLAKRSGILLADAVLGRAEAQIMRAACLFALLDSSPVVKSAHLHAGWELWNFSEASVRYIFGDRLGDPLADKILNALRSENGWLTRTQIHEALGRNVPVARIDTALQVLTKAGRVTMQRRPSGGARPVEIWRAL